MRRIVVALIALAVFLPSLAQARARWMTDVDLYVRENCCCPPKKAQPAPALPTLQKQCCNVVKHAAAALPLVDSAASPLAALPVTVPVAVAIVMPPLRDVTVVIVPRAQAPPRSTLLAQHRALLL